MNIKLIMASSAILMAAAGIFLSFAPDLLLNYLQMESNTYTLLPVQMLGALYFGFAMLNWMAKGALIGGIYNKPIVVANLAHFFIGALTIFKVLIADNTLPQLFWIIVIIYTILAVIFAVLMNRHPISKTER